MTQDEVIHGNWFLPDNEENHFNGQLSFGPNTPIRLSLIATLKTRLSSFGFGIGEYTIWGYGVDGQPITLLGCNRLNIGSGLGIDQATFNAHYIIIGKHTRDHKTKEFNGVTFSVSNLDAWLQHNGFDVISNSSTEYTVNYKRPSDIPFSINETISGNFTTRNNVPINTREKIELLQANFIELNFTESVDIEKATKNVYQFQQLLAILMFENVSVNEIYLTSENRQIRLFYRQIGGLADNDRDLNLVRFPFIRSFWGDIVSKWFVLCETLAPVINILYANVGESGDFVHNNFLNIVQAVEAFHRRQIQNTEQLKSNYAKLLSRIVDKIEDEEDCKWLKEKLSFSYEPSLRTRLKELIALHSAILFAEETKTSDTKQIIKEVVDKRNYYTHYDPSLEKQNEDIATLLRLTQFLKLLLTYCLLNELGMNAAFLSDKVYQRFRIRITKATTRKK